MILKNIFLLMFLVFVLFSLSGNAQESTITIKKNAKKEIINGKKYFVHEVQKGETLYAISKAYNIDQNIIAFENPDVFEKFIPGQILYIPYEIESNLLNSPNFKIHIVTKGETLYSISKKYNVSITDINKYNPKAETSLQIGQNLKIPQKPAINTVNISQTKDTSKYIFHKIEKNQTMYSISKQYNVPIDEIYKSNTELETKGLKNGETVKIPKYSVNIINDEISLEPKVDTVTTALIPDVTHNMPAKITDCGKYDYSVKRENFKIALLLPLQSDAITIDNEDEKSSDPNSDFEPQPKPFLEYYEGFLLAVDSMKKNGENITVKLFDIKTDSAKTLEIISKNELENMDIIIGPVYEQNFKLISNYAKKKGINIIYPVNSQNSEIYLNPRVFQVNSSFSMQITQATRYLASFKDINYVVIQNGSKDELEIINIYKKKLFKQYLVNFKSENVPYKEVMYSSAGISGVENALNKDIINSIIIPSDEQIFVINLFTKLQPLTKKFKIILAGMPSWKNFDNNIELEYLHNLNMHSFVPFYTDYSNSYVKSFVLDYRYNFKCEPSKYSLLGYDTGLYFLTALKNYGHNFQDCLPNLKVQLLQSDFNFVKLGDKGGYENNGTFILHYNQDNDVKVVNVVTDTIKNPLTFPDIQIRKIKP